MAGIDSGNISEQLAEEDFPIYVLITEIIEFLYFHCVCVCVFAIIVILEATHLLTTLYFQD